MVVKHDPVTQEDLVSYPTCVICHVARCGIERGNYPVEVIGGRKTEN